MRIQLRAATSGPAVFPSSRLAGPAAEHRELGQGIRAPRRSRRFAAVMKPVLDGERVQHSLEVVAQGIVCALEGQFRPG